MFTTIISHESSCLHAESCPSFNPHRYLTLRLRVVFYFPRLRVIIRKMTYENHISRMQRTKKRFFFLFLRHGVDEEYIQEEKEFSHMNVSLIHPILTLNPPIGLWMNSSQILDCCMSLESLKVVPASNRVKEVSYGIRTISWLFVG